ncbi:serine protease [Nocardiopsis sp. NPDC007018]|uniref:S1 family peptidase n=1 Tax=Nocardiopsis sp. NPDC007018 TaxID=3155721 RepID=UPI0033ECC524
MDTPRQPPPDPRPNEPFWQLRVLGRHGAVVGGAVLVSPGLLVTCAHVVSDVLGTDPDSPDHPGTEEPVILLSFDGRPWTAFVSPELWSSGPGSRDLALLQFPKGRGQPDTGFPTLGRVRDLERGQPLTTVGYPMDLRSLSAQLSYEGMSGPTDHSHQVLTPHPHAAQISPGFSGCAVRGASGEVVGIVQHTLDDGHRDSGISFFLPVEEMVGARDGVGEPVTLERLAVEALCGRQTYESLHDTLESVSVDQAPPEHLLSPLELRRARQRHGALTNAWDVFVPLLDHVSPRGEPPLHLAWVHHVFWELRGSRRIVPPVVWRWIGEEADGLGLGSTWEEALKEQRDQRTGRTGERLADRNGAPGADASKRAPQPETMVLFELEQVSDGYQLSHSVAYHVGSGYDLRPQDTRLVREEQICDQIGALIRDVSMNRLVPANGRPLRLRVLLPKNLLHLDLGQATLPHDSAAIRPHLGALHEIVYHIRDRVLDPDFMTWMPGQWQDRSQRQARQGTIGPHNLLRTWEQEVSELANVLTNDDYTVCVVDSDDPDAGHVYEAVILQGIPTILRGPRAEVAALVKEILEQAPDARVRVAALADHLRKRSWSHPEGRSVALVQDDFGDELLQSVLTRPHP